MIYDQECRLQRNVGLKSIYTCVPRRVPCKLLGQMAPCLLTNEKENIYTGSKHAGSVAGPVSYGHCGQRVAGIGPDPICRI